MRAAAAPSVLNTQPWRLRIRDGALHVYADPDRQLVGLDPDRRALTLSVGCAVFDARVALAGLGFGAVVHRFPEATSPHLVAVLEARDDLPADPLLTRLDAGTVRPLPDDRSADACDVPAELLADLTAVLAAEGTHLHVLDPAGREAVAELNRQADEIENLDPTYRAELHAWTADDPHHRDRIARPAQCLAVLASPTDDPVAWLRTGESMRRSLLEIARAGFAVSPATQVTEVPSARAQLRAVLHTATYPHAVLRVGRSYGSAATRRRHLVDVLVEES